MKKILVIRFSSIGDIVLTSPVLRCLRQSLTDTEIHFLTKTRFRLIADNNPVVDKVFSFEKGISEVLPYLKAERYDHIIDLQGNLRSLLVKLALRAPSRTFPKLNVRKWLYVRFKIGRLPALHIVDRYFKAVKHLGVKNDGQGLDYFITVKDRVDPETTFGWAPYSYVALVTGAAHLTKRIPLEKLREICSLSPHPVVALGGPDDVSIGETLALEFPDKVYNACGRCTLNQSASVIKQAGRVITADTGLMHIASAFQRPVTVLWGNTVPQFGMYPYIPGNKWQSLEVHGLKCRPCSKIGFEKCPQGHFKCMLDHETSRINFSLDS